MKLIAILLLGLVAISQADLQKHFDDLKQSLPREELQKIVNKHAFLDNEFIQFRKFLRTAEFSQVWDTLLATERIHDLVAYLSVSGADIIKGINDIAKLLNLKTYPEIKEHQIQPRTVQSFIKEVVQALSKTEIPTIMKQKMSDPDFKNFITIFTSDDLKVLLEHVIVDPAVKAQLTILEKHGLRYKDVINAAAEVLSWAL